MGLRAIGIIPRMIGPCVHTDLLCRFLSGCSVASGFVHPTCAAPCVNQNHRSVFWRTTSWAKNPQTVIRTDHDWSQRRGL